MLLARATVAELRQVGPAILMSYVRTAVFGSQLRRNVLSGSLTAVLQIGVMSIMYPVYLSYLGYEAYGLWLTLAIVLEFTQVANFGVGHALMKLVAEHDACRERAIIESYVATAIAMLLVIGGVLAIGTTIAVDAIVAAVGFDANSAQTAAWLLPLISLVSAYVIIVQAFHGVLAGLGRMDLANYAVLAGRVVSLVVATTLLALGRGLESILVGTALGWVSTHAACLVFIRRTASIRFFVVEAIDATRMRALFGFGSQVVGGSVLGMLMGPFNKLMITRYLGVSAVPIFEIAHRGAMEVRGLVATGLTALMPETSRLSSLRSADARVRIRELNARALRVILVGAGPLYAVLVAVAPPCLSFWLGSRYVDSLADIFRIMLGASFVSLVGVPAYFTLMGVGRVRDCLLANGVQSLANVAVVFAVVIVGRGLSLLSIAVAFTLAVGSATAFLVSRQRELNCRAALPAQGATIADP